MGQAILGEDENQRLATLPAGGQKAPEKEDQGAKLPSAENQIAEKATRSQTKEREDAIDALGAAYSSWSLEDDTDAKARREAQLRREQIQKTHGDKIEALKNAEAKRRADEECDTFERQLKAKIDGARLKKMKRKARKEKDQEAARELRVAAEAEAIAIAERRARQERRAHEEALNVQAKREADNRARQELSEAYNKIFCNTTIAESNARQAQTQQQREAELIAQYHEVATRQAQFAELQRRQQEELYLQQHHAQLAELERRQQEELFLQQHYAHLRNRQVNENVESMDTAPEMEPSWGTEMEWEMEEEQSRLPAELLPPFSPPTPRPSAPVQSLPSSLIAAKETGNKAKAENFSPHSFSQSATMVPTVATAKPEPAARTPFHLPPLREALKARRIDTGSQAPVASPAQLAAQVATLQPSLAPAQPLPAVPPVASPPPPPPPPQLKPTPTPLAPPPPLARPARPTPSIQRALTIVFKKRAVENSTLVAIRPTVNACSPLGRLLSQHKGIPKVTLTQVLGKRARQDVGEGGRDKKMPKFKEEIQFQIGGKRKREDEEFPGKKRAFRSRALAVPCSRFAASRSDNSAVLPPTPALNSTPPNHPPTPGACTPSAPPPTVLEPLQINPHGGLAEAVDFYNDLPTLRREIAWMRAHRQVATSREETQSKKTSICKEATKRTVTRDSYWSKYRENLSR